MGSHCLGCWGVVIAAMFWVAGAPYLWASGAFFLELEMLMGPPTSGSQGVLLPHLLNCWATTFRGSMAQSSTPGTVGLLTAGGRSRRAPPSGTENPKQESVDLGPMTVGRLWPSAQLQATPGLSASESAGRRGTEPLHPLAPLGTLTPDYLSLEMQGKSRHCTLVLMHTSPVQWQIWLLQEDF